MIRRLWHFLFGGCLHEFKWTPRPYTNCMAQRGVCSKCGFTKDKTVAVYASDGVTQ